MILKFPDLATLRLALTTGAVPPGLSQTPAVAGFDEQGQVWVESPGSLSRAHQNDLKHLGAVLCRTSGASLKTEVTCWPEMLPLEADRAPVERLEQMTVLFELPSGEALARLVLEVLRLGNDRQGFRWLEDARGSGRALLRVVGPPYYSLLRALDRQGREEAPVAYVERAPRIWVELGHNHPLADRLKVPAGKLLLLRPPRHWTLFGEAPYRDVFEVLEISLPDGPVGWKDGELQTQIEVTPRLKPGGSADGAELWVLRDDPVKELNRFVQNADDQMLHRLQFAVGERDGKKTVVLRVLQSKLQPPVLVLKAEAYKHYLKLANLFLPAGMRLHPPLRRDAVRKLLAEDAAVVTWLTPAGDGSFTPQTLPQDAFRPLTDWVDYVLDHDREALAAWVQASQFDFEPFVCDEDHANKPKKPPAGDRAKAPRGERGKREHQEDVASAVDFRTTEEKKPALEDFGKVAMADPSELQKQLRALEERFLGLEGGLDEPERLSLWPELARLNASLGSAEDAGICWMNALWEGAEAPPRLLWAWFCAEAAAVPARAEGRGGRGVRTWASRVTVAAERDRGLNADEVERVLALPDPPGTADVRALAAYLAWAARREPAPAALVERLAPLGRFLEKYERFLPVRAQWLAWLALAWLAGNDALALARARDRLLERLYQNGLRPEQDLPSFLRFAGQPTSQRFRAVRDWLSELGDLAQKWLQLQGPPLPSQSGHPQTLAYVDLIFAFGLARLGQAEAARERLELAKEALGTLDEAHKFLLTTFKYRIEQAREGKPHTGPLLPEHLEYLEGMERLQRYYVDRLRLHSRVLEPDQRIDPYRHWKGLIGELDKALAALTDVTDRGELERRVEKLLAEVPRGAKGDTPRAKVLRAGLEAAPRVGEEFGKRMLNLALPAYDALPPPNKDLEALTWQSEFLEKALFVAGHFGRADHVHALVARFQRLLQSQRGPQALPALEKLAGQCFRGLRKLGMRNEIDQLLGQMADLVLEGKAVEAMDFAKAENTAALRALLHVAAGWYYFGRDSHAEPILQAARGLLLQGTLEKGEQTKLAVSYAEAVGQAPVEVAQRRMEEIFREVKGVRDGYSTAGHYSRAQLDVVEAVVLAVVSDDFTLGSQARRWLDDDEFLVRRRLHRDLREMMEKQ
jgi:hypothetical protein